MGKCTLVTQRCPLCIPGWDSGTAGCSMGLCHPHSPSRFFSTEFCVLPNTKPFPAPSCQTGCRVALEDLLLHLLPVAQCTDPHTRPPQWRLPCSIPAAYHFAGERDLFSGATGQPKAALLGSSPTLLNVSFFRCTKFSSQKSVGYREAAGRCP